MIRKNIKIFNKEIPIRTHFCKFFDNDPLIVTDPTISIFVRTKFCNSKCKFCIWSDDADTWNEDRFIESLKEVSSKIRIKKISFTGGEPTMNFNRLKSIIKISREFAPTAELSLNTDGLRLKELFEDDIIEYLDCVALSRHHFDDELNEEIFGTKCPYSIDISDIQKNYHDKDKLHFSCNLINGYIDNEDKIYKFLEWTNSINVRSVGFVSLMPVNEYSKDNFISFNIKDLINDRFNLTKKWQYKNICECNNYVYIPENLKNIIKVYQKNTYNPYDMIESLTFNGYNLNLGFTDEIIY